MKQESIHIDLSLDGRKIEVTYYKARKRNAPILFGTYGMSIPINDYFYENIFWEMISKRFECNVVFIGCKNILKYKFPCVINCVYDVISYFMKNDSKFDFDKNKVMVFGSSMGANFAAATTLIDIENKTNYIKTQILNYPCLDLETYSKEKSCDDCIFANQYVTDTAELKNPFVSPIYASKKLLKNMPKTIIVCGENDSLSGGGEKYAQILKSEGIEVYCEKYRGMEHGFMELYFLLKYVPFKSEAISNKMIDSFKSGTLYKSVISATQFIKEHCI
ncbi:alpha/beta hydrolase [Terrisporobacter glycolicus]|nr:alpha/beta hydrolase [Terrisporobacter glycolicus]